MKVDYEVNEAVTDQLCNFHHWKVYGSQQERSVTKCRSPSLESTEWQNSKLIEEKMIVMQMSSLLSPHFVLVDPASWNAWLRIDSPQWDDCFLSCSDQIYLIPRFRYIVCTNLRMPYKPNHLMEPVEQKDYLAMTSTKEELLIEIARKPGLTMMHVWSLIYIGMLCLGNWCDLAWRSHSDRFLIARSRAAGTGLPDTAATLIDNDSMPLALCQVSRS